jgi:hypothetical protein
VGPTCSDPAVSTQCKPTGAYPSQQPSCYSGFQAGNTTAFLACASHMRLAPLAYKGLCLTSACPSRCPQPACLAPRHRDELRRTERRRQLLIVDSPSALSVGGIHHNQELHLAKTHLLRPFASPVDHKVPPPFGDQSRPPELPPPAGIRSLPCCPHR